MENLSSCTTVNVSKKIVMSVNCWCFAIILLLTNYVGVKENGNIAYITKELLSVASW